MTRIIRYLCLFVCMGMILWGSLTDSIAAESVRFISNRIKIERPEPPSVEATPTASPEAAAPSPSAAPIETAAIDRTNSPDQQVDSEVPGQSNPAVSVDGTGDDKKDETQSIKAEIESLIGKKQRLYSRKDRIDPFEPFLKKPEPEITSTDKEKLQIRPPQTPLEMVDLSQLRLTAVLRTPSKNSALVEESSGKGYVVSENTYIGNKGGQISKILKDRIVVEEKYLDMFGKIAVREKELKLQN